MNGRARFSSLVIVAAGAGLLSIGCDNGKAPLLHRFKANTCSTNFRPAPPPCTAQDGSFPAQNDCSTNGDCSAGTNGRCLMTPSVPAPDAPVNCLCSYDTCFKDSDCLTTGPCDCLSGTRTTAANRCLPGNCRVDADCGPGRYCSPTRHTVTLYFDKQVWQGYYCHTAADACVNDSDCSQDWLYGAHCAYDTLESAWNCFNYYVP
jgi:hypothetical protein